MSPLLITLIIAAVVISLAVGLVLIPIGRPARVWKRLARRHDLTYLRSGSDRVLFGKLDGKTFSAQVDWNRPNFARLDLDVGRVEPTGEKGDALDEFVTLAGVSEAYYADGTLSMVDRGGVWTDEEIDRRVGLLRATARRLTKHEPRHLRTRVATQTA